jgi:hypothetical protein
MKNKTLINVILVMSSYVKVTKAFWRDATLMENYQQQKSPKIVVTKNKTPYELWYGKQPNLSYLKILNIKNIFFFIRREKKVELIFS